MSVISASRAPAANEFDSRRADEAKPVASGDVAIVVRRISKDAFGDEANFTQDRKESWFRFMDWTWIASMICIVDSCKVDLVALYASALHGAALAVYAALRGSQILR